MIHSMTMQPFGPENPEHIREAAAAAAIPLSRTDWYKLWVAARGEKVP